MASIFPIPLFKFAWSLLHKQINKEIQTDKNQILEPLSTVLKLSLISFEEEGIKIAVSNNSVYIQKPTLLQGTIRSVYGNNREEIHYLLKPIIRCVEMYPSDNNRNIRYLYDLAIDGLKKLKRSYGNQSSNVCYTIDLYITILKGKKIEEERITDNDISLFKDLWTDSDIVLVSNLFQSNYLQSIYNIIYTKEQSFSERLETSIF
jgi:hypothetical protein